ncbi:MAG: AAA family ATPase [Eubacterium sp.]|nr:AAA family ATPase [Eubacterium sp.]
MEVYVGKALLDHLSERSIDNYKNRFAYENLLKYARDSSNPRVYCLYGLRRTGKTTMLSKAILDLNDIKNCIYVTCEKGDKMSDLKEVLNEHNKKYIFIDEATRLSNFIDTCSVLADKYAYSGRRVFMTGTDSLGFLIAKNDELFDRVIMHHTTYISFMEFHYLLDKNIEEYIRYGGTLSLEGNMYNDPAKEPFEEYLDGAIVRNILHTLKYWDYERHLGVLQKLYDDDDLESAIRKVVERENRDFLAATINKNFKGEIRGSLIDLLNKSTDVQTDALENKELNDRTRIMLGIHEPLFNTVSQSETDQIIRYLLDMDVMIKGYDEGEYIFTQPGLRFYHAKILSDSLERDDKFNLLSDADKAVIKTKLFESIKGQLLEDIVYTDLIKKYKGMFNVIKYKYPSGGEFDAAVCDLKNQKSIIFEVKYSKIKDSHQVSHLRNQEICDAFEKKTGTGIVSKVVIYNGVSDAADEIKYINAEDFLIHTDSYVNKLLSGDFFLGKRKSVISHIEELKKESVSEKAYQESNISTNIHKPTDGIDR